MIEGQPGTPDPDAVAAVEAANAVPEGAEIVRPSQKAPIGGAAREQLMELLRDPDTATAIVQAATETQEGRRLLGVQPGQGRPSGEWTRDYDAPELRVFGGTEVRHPPGFEALPPSYIPRYVRADGRGTTDHAKPLIQKRKQQVPILVDGKPAVNAEGSPLFEEELVDVIVDPGAALDERGRPVKTDAYKHWIDVRVTGGRLDGEVRSQIAAGVYSTDGGPAVSVDRDGTPAVAVADPGVEIG